MLNDLIHNEGICEKDIITDRTKVPEIWWEDEDGVRHRHYVDIFIISQNKCIEVKSDWILYNRTKGAFKKQEAGKKLGYKYEIRVYNKKGDLIEFKIDSQISPHLTSINMDFKQELATKRLCHHSQCNFS